MITSSEEIDTMSGQKNVVLIVGGGGREHALACKIAESKKVDRVIVAPGNGGTAVAGGKIVNIKISPENIEGLVALAKEEKVSLVIVGPEQPLVDGLSDLMKAAKIPCFGPSALAANIEASKAWSKDFMARNLIRTAKYRNFTDFASAKEYLEGINFKVVVKASGLAAGKGVIIPSNKEESIEAARQIMCDQSFGNAGSEVVIEEFLEGEEISLLAFCDGVNAVCMPGAQDHKRINNGACKIYRCHSCRDHFFKYNLYTAAASILILLLLFPSFTQCIISRSSLFNQFILPENILCIFTIAFSLSR